MIIVPVADKSLAGQSLAIFKSLFFMRRTGAVTWPEDIGHEIIEDRRRPRAVEKEDEKPRADISMKTSRGRGPRPSTPGPRRINGHIPARQCRRL
jgi:hypothetical protein